EPNACILHLVSEAFPHDGWLSEETADSLERPARSRVWVVDPLAGSQGCRQDVPEVCVCVGLVEAGRPVAAARYNPAADRPQEAGGRVTDLAGAPLVFDQPPPLRPGLVASNGTLRAALRALIAEVARAAAR